MKKLNLLLLEDNADDAEIIIQTVKRSGIDCEIAVAAGRDEYVEQIRNNVYDLILADNSLPQYDANLALEVLSELNLQIPFILVTGSISEEFAVEIMKKGAWDYVLKDRLQRLPNAILSAYDKSVLLTEKRLHLDTLVKNEALMKEAERLAHFGSWEEDRRYNTIRWSEEYYRILGYEPGEVEPGQDNFLNKVHPDDLEQVKREMDIALGGKDRHLFNCRILAQKSVVKHVKCELVITRDDAGNIVRLNGMNKDVTEAIHAEEKLQKSEANLRTIFDNSDTGYILLDTDYNIISFNKIFHEFSTLQLNLPIHEGANLQLMAKDGKGKLLTESLQNALENATVNCEIPLSQQDGSVRWYYVGYHLVAGADGQTLGIIVSVQDITSRKILELQEKKITQDLVQRKNELEQFTYIISHNLRAPVANIMGITSILDNEYEFEDDQKALIEGMTASVAKLDGVIADLNQIIQLKQGINEKKELLSFTQLVEDIEIVISNIITNNNVEIRFDFSEIDEVMTVRGFMHSIFYNLISNSVKYRQPDIPPVITITSSKRDDSLELVFSDNGVGIDLEKKGGMLFGLYKRFHTDLADGKGIGLFMVKNHVESLGGVISVASQVHKGTTFTLSFELSEFEMKK